MPLTLLGLLYSKQVCVGFGGFEGRPAVTVQ